MSYDNATLAKEAIVLFDRLNVVLQADCSFCAGQNTWFYFVSGFGGTGKTFLSEMLGS
jgi:hypothetical protein